ncbi:MAG: immunoglobulin domain-containing protein, partial [Limisphaerales bacterium]
MCGDNRILRVLQAQPVMKKFLTTVVCSFGSVLLLSAQPVPIALNGTNYTQNFNGMPSQASSPLPLGWGINASTTFTGGATTVAAYAGTTGTGALTGSSTGSSYLFINGVRDSGNDKAIGYLSSGSYADNRNILFAFTNNTGSTITELQLSWAYEKYRSGQATRDWTFFASKSETNWGSAISAGGHSYAADANNTTVFNPPESVTKSVTLSSLVIEQGEVFYFRWNYDGSGTGGNGQALGIDDFSLTAVHYVPPSGPPVISANPQSATVWKGTNLVLAVEATGAAPLSFQWFHDSAPILNATNSTLALNSITPAQGGAYHVVVSNPEDSATSSVANVTVLSPLSTTIAYLRSLVDNVNWLPTDTENLYEIEGFVTPFVNLAGTNDTAFYMQDDTAGISVYITGRNADKPTRGAKVRVVGRLGHFNGLLQLNLNDANPTHSYTLLQPTSLPNVIPISFDVAANIPYIESIEGSRVILSNVFLDL